MPPQSFQQNLMRSYGKAQGESTPESGTEIPSPPGLAAILRRPSAPDDKPAGKALPAGRSAQGLDYIQITPPKSELRRPADRAHPAGPASDDHGTHFASHSGIARLRIDYQPRGVTTSRPDEAR